MDEGEFDHVFRSDRAVQREELAHRVSLLLDLWEWEHKAPLRYQQVVDFLEGRGVAISRTRWSYLISGEGFTVSDPDLLMSLAELFGVDAAYLLDLGSEPSEALQARLVFVRDMRELRVQQFAARNLSGISPETLRLITDAIRRSRRERDSPSASA